MSYFPVPMAGRDRIGLSSQSSVDPTRPTTTAALGLSVIPYKYINVYFTCDNHFQVRLLPDFPGW